jgi:hypothetical protein
MEMIRGIRMHYAKIVDSKWKETLQNENYNNSVHFWL